MEGAIISIFILHELVTEDYSQNPQNALCNIWKLAIVIFPTMFSTTYLSDSLQSPNRYLSMNSTRRPVINDLFQNYAKPTLLLGGLVFCYTCIFQLGSLTSCKLWKDWKILSHYIIIKYIAYGNFLSIASILVLWIHKTLTPIITVIGKMIT